MAAPAESTPLLPAQSDSLPRPTIPKSPLSRMTYSYLAPLFKRQLHAPQLDANDLFELPEDLTAEYNARRMYHAWDAELRERGPGNASLVSALLKSGVANSFLVAAPLRIFFDIATFATPVVFEKLIRFFSAAPRPSLWYACSLVVLMFLLFVLAEVILHPQYMHLCGDSGVRAEASLAMLLQRKSLRLDVSGRDRSGQIVSLLTVDCKSAGPELWHYLHLVWSGPIKVIAGFGLLYELIGPPAIAGMAVMVLAVCLQSLQVQFMYRMEEQMLAWADKRLRLIGEVLNIIRQIKVTGLEWMFQKRIGNLREREMEVCWRAHVYDALCWSVWDSLSTIFVCACFGAAALWYPETLVPEKVFSVLAVIEVIRFPLIYLPESFQGLMQARVSLDRIRAFLLLPEAVGRLQDSNLNERELRAGALQGGVLSWGNNQVIEGQRFDFPPRKLTLLLGAVASGKSSILAGLLGEMQWDPRDQEGCNEHRPTLNGRIVSYCPQEPFLFDGSVFENVVHFSGIEDHERYLKTLKACALDADIASMPDGDQTMLGSRGYQLSGGQKARVALARAVYLNADCYVFDMTLAALDAHVASHVFDAVMGPSGLLAGRTRLLVSHASHLIEHADMCVWVSGGKLTWKQSTSSLEGMVSGESDKVAGQREIGAVDNPTFSRKNEGSTTSRLVEEELEQVASGSKRDLAGYVLSSGIFIPTLCALLVFLSQSSLLMVDFFLASWSNSVGTQPAVVSSGKYLSALLALSCIAAVLQFVRQFVASFGGIQIAVDIHCGAVASLFRAKNSFFDITPHGQLLNRFSGDMKKISWGLPIRLLASVTYTTHLLMMAVCSLFLAPLATIVTIPSLYIFLHLSQEFSRGLRQLQGLTSASESPLLSSFSESLDASGIQVLRAAGQVDKHLQKFMANRDRYTRAEVLSSNVAYRYLDTRVSLLGASMIAGIGFACIAAVDWISSGMVGLTLIWSFKLMMPMAWLPSWYGSVETGLVSFERIQSYLISLPKEGPRETSLDQALSRKGWPTSGAICIKNAKLRYRRGLPLALKGLNLEVPGGTSLGIAGRTGAGKSSILSALLRSTELESGSIVIDGVDIRHIGLSRLREAVAVLPQDAFLFRGTVRENVDPSGSAADPEVWAALRVAQMEGAAQRLGGLGGEIADGGGNMSPGERQLLALARVVCRWRAGRGGPGGCGGGFSVLLLDEASSQLDVETTGVIQRAVEAHLKGVTMLVIAHRLDTVVGCDQVCVIEDGVCVEAGRPGELLGAEKQGRGCGRFLSLAREQGLV